MNTQSRILAVSLSTNGFGFAVMEGRALVDYGNKIILGDKNANSLAQIDKLFVRFRPDVLVLSDVNAKGTYRSSRIKQLHKSVVMLAKNHKLTVATVSGAELRTALLNDPQGTKHDLTKRAAEMFPDELASRVPPKRKAWNSEKRRMDMFEAVALALAYRQKRII